MECSSCKSIVVDGSKFCNNCGKAIINELTCAKCNTVNPSGSKFCNSCGTPFLSSNQESSVKTCEKIILGGDFAITLRELFYEKILSRIKDFNGAEDDHSKVNIMDGSAIKRDFNLAVRNCFDYLVSEAKESLSPQNINDIKNRKEKFLSESTDEFNNLLEELDAKAKTVLDEVPNSITHKLMNSLENIDLDDIVGAFQGNIGSVFSLFKADKANEKKDKKNEKIIDEWNSVYGLIGEEYDSLWAKLFSEITELAKVLPITFDFTNEVFNKYDEENKNPIEAIIENNLNFEESGFLFFSNIPVKKREGALGSYVDLEDDEEIICLHDSTVFGGAKEGICLTNYCIYWKMLGEEGNSASYFQIESIVVKNKVLFINDVQVETCPCTKKLKKTLDEIVLFIKELDNKDNKS